ncbi:MAG: beta-L-arabinofuranosidase domain-containing protein, partial [Anaerolineae bacterium]
DSSLVSARHWLDVDLCHYSPDPLLHGGLKIHTRYHVTGRVTPSHEWTEGLLDYYFFTGRREALDAAHSVAENILRHMDRPHMKTPGETSVREGGWALRALVGMWIGTGEDRWRDEARKLVTMYLDWFDRYGALLAPYTSHSMPRVTFMISLTVNSFARYLLVESDGELAERVKALIVGTVDDMLAHCIGPDGVSYYKELPSLRRTAPTYHLLEALTHAYRITGDEKYLKIATRQFAAAGAETGARDRPKYADDSGAVIDGEGRGRPFADKYTSMLLYAGAATPLGLLDWYEYPY